ncbi:cytochrome b [Corticimicrobacter populi]|uniref:Cytochrome b n=1 Tax=Corticimicrobacter populi TaxID=2175229 RepID=A0A2V1JV66_9BURK|nr:cytochrome b [Corticimicrobacter populi]PWF22090.1 cytochrome b [Corticimicrobacter populi]
MTIRYTRTARSLHWLMALLLTGLVGLGFYMQTMPLSPTKLQVYSWHKWLGITIFLLAVIRLAWRAGHKPPALPDHMGSFERLAAHGGHVALYLLMLGIPLSGWLMSSAMGFQTVWFGVLPLPDLLARDRELGKSLVQVHATLNIALIVMVVLHILAALKHQFIDKDQILSRMMFTSSKEK